jgi:hypothetical protein
MPIPARLPAKAAMPIAVPTIRAGEDVGREGEDVGRETLMGEQRDPEDQRRRPRAVHHQHERNDGDDEGVTQHRSLAGAVDRDAALDQQGRQVAPVSAPMAARA